MNIQHSSIAIFGLMAVVTATGCTAVTTPGTTDNTQKAELSAWSAPCNLGVEREESGPGWTAVYDVPTLGAQTDLDLYGGTLANDACTDAQILQWQQVRRQSGQSDAICRVIWSTDSDGSIRDLGCAVPVMVVERRTSASQSPGVYGVRSSISGSKEPHVPATEPDPVSRTVLVC